MNEILTDKNQTIRVKCNTALAETLINTKNKEINSLEEKYESKINFAFDNHFSLHEPLIESNSDIEINVSKNDDIIKIKKTKKQIKKNKIISKKKTVVKKTKTKEPKISKGKKQLIKDKEVSVKKENKIENEEKTGWWS